MQEVKLQKEFDEVTTYFCIIYKTLQIKKLKNKKYNVGGKDWMTEWGTQAAAPDVRKSRASLVIIRQKYNYANVTSNPLYLEESVILDQVKYLKR